MQSVPSRTDFLSDLWKEYALSDSRYMTMDPAVFLIEGITAYLWGPLCLYNAYLIFKADKMAPILTGLVSLGQLYGIDAINFKATSFTMGLLWLIRMDIVLKMEYLNTGSTLYL